MIHIQNLEKDFKSFKALKGVTLSVKKGEIYGFIGRNGSGKSTTMNIIAGLSKPNAGQCIVNGLNVVDINHPSDLNIGYLPENPQFYPWMTAYEHLNYMASSLEATHRKDRLIELLEWVGLSEAKHRRVGGFSRGMKQRLGIACALIHNPELLILDEPSSALDPEGRSDVLKLITDLKAMGKTIIFSTHILSDVERVCDRIALIYDGEIILEKPLNELMKQNSKPIIDVEFEEITDENLLSSLNNHTNTLNVTVHDHTISIFLDHLENIQKMISYVANQGIQVTSIRLRKNTLEDLFIKEVNGK